MKNKMLALSAALLLASGIAFGFTHFRNSGACCNAQTATCNGQPCPSGACPAPCCPAK